jgi:hypothetical protein
MQGMQVLDIPIGNKFAMVAVTTEPRPPEVLLPLWFDGGLWAVSRPPLALDATWKRWLGLRAEELDKSNLFLIATSPSGTPEILDDEHERLERVARFAFLALAIQGLYIERPGLILQGSRLANPFGLQVRSVHDTMPVFRLEGSERMPLTMQRLVAAGRMAWHMREIASRKQVPRLWKGVRSLTFGIQSRAGEDRLHAFVRALEAVIKPPQGRSERIFVHRCQTFTGRQDQNRGLLRELYRLRSAAEHLHDMSSVLTGHEFDRERIALQRTEQAEVII